MADDLSEFQQSMWEHRPFWAAGDPDFYPTSIEEAAVDLWWHIGTAVGLHGAAFAVGAKESTSPLRAMNIIIGEAGGFYRPGQVVQTARATHVTGSAMTLTEAAWFHRWRVLRAAGSVVRFLNPVLTAAWIGMELYEHRSTQRPGHEQRVADVQAWQDSIMPPPE